MLISKQADNFCVCNFKHFEMLLKFLVSKSKWSSLNWGLAWKTKPHCFGDFDFSQYHKSNVSCNYLNFCLWPLALSHKWWEETPGLKLTNFNQMLYFHSNKWTILTEHINLGSDYAIIYFWYKLVLV